MKRPLALVVAAAIAACAPTAIIVGDDTAAPSPTTGPIAEPDAGPFDAHPLDDAPPITVPPQDAADASDGSPCPTLSPPSPSFCDGASPVAMYDSKACVVGYGCAPVACTAAGGKCVGLAPGTCPANKFGDATKYSCGGGVGVACCLP